jgi:hypothetical protein
MDVGQLLAALNEGIENGSWNVTTPVKICTTFPYHQSIETVEVPESNITSPCVGIYS